MESSELKKKFLRFFRNKGHVIIPSASLIPEHDPSVLFTSAGMHPLVPYLLGEPHPEGRKLTDVQKCVRTGDIDVVGDAWHLTFFEMLGNWSLGDYFKEEAIVMAWEFLTSQKWLGLDPERLSVSVFAGDNDAPRDNEAAKIWQKVGMPKKRIYYYPKSENWWGPAGKIGPCGPDTEIFFDSGKEPCGEKCEPKCICDKYTEIWNLVFMQYDKKIKDQPSSPEPQVEGKSKIKNANQRSKMQEIKTIYEYVPLNQKNIDTGMGLERTIAILNGKDNIYQTDLFKPLIDKLTELLEGRIIKKDSEDLRSMRIIADHIRAAVFILAEGITPSNLDQGYVLRRLIRRAIRKTSSLKLEKGSLLKLAKIVIDQYKQDYSRLFENKDFIRKELSREEEKFKKPLKWVEQYRSDLREAIEHDLIKKIKDAPILSASGEASGQYVYENYQTYGVPPDLSEEIIRELGLKYNKREFERAFKKHQALSRKGSAEKFQGGLADAKEATIKYHTATHLLHQALRQVLGDHVEQRGSNITAERLRFDFSHPKKVEAEELKEVEEIVNKKIKEKLSIKCEEMSPEEAKKQGAIGLFGRKYGDKIKVYTIGEFSKEICGGPHIKNTKELGKFKIIKEESSSAGIRRIKATLE